MKNNHRRKNIFRNGKYLSVKEAAKKVFFNEKTVLYWIRQRSVEAFRCHGRWWILESSLDSFINYRKAVGK
ncbi:MAG: helix-turn-helix domain-containing protein [Sphaerospermopsis sp. SIO1G2]|nr:helix-turn-helix domain-containing protein [Sphaerospermopsis sp. SIO1G2]